MNGVVVQNYKGVIHKPCVLSRGGFENLKKYIRVTLQHHTNWSDLGEGVVFGKKNLPLKILSILFDNDTRPPMNDLL